VSFIVAEHLSKVFPCARAVPVRALSDISLSIHEKEFFVLAGPSGSGKTTLLRLIAGLETSSAGTLAIAGRDVKSVPAREREIAMVFQNPALLPHMTARQNIAVGLRIRRTPKQEAEQRVAEAAELLGITDCLDRLPEFLSGGERQRVALGRVVLRRPKIVLFDEPLSNLDAPLRGRMRMEISRLHQQLGWTTVYVTHDQTEAMALATRLAVLNLGELQQVDKPLQVYHHPSNIFTARFFGAPPMNIISVDENRAIGIRPENLLLAEPSNEDGALSGTVEFIEQLGADVHVHLRTSGGMVIWRASTLPSATRIGDSLTLKAKQDAVVFFDRKTGRALS
jgi:ABC-type sugar transport system ATPase subunit